MNRLSLTVSLVFVLFLTTSASAITWYPKEFVCPIDQEKNTFMVVGSYGSYIYNYPSKYQWLFFPNTSSNNFYMCKKCHLTTYMWDFDKFPKDKIEEVGKMLAKNKIDQKFKDYRKVPVTTRLEMMERVYREIGQDDVFWEQFHRIRGYHYGKDGESEKAFADRKKSLSLIQAEISKEGKSKIPLKLLFYMSGAMKHFLEDDKGARDDLNKAKSVMFANPKEKDPDALKNAEAGLNERLADYISLIGTEKAPRTADKPPAGAR